MVEKCEGIFFCFKIFVLVWNDFVYIYIIRKYHNEYFHGRRYSIHLVLWERYCCLLKIWKICNIIKSNKQMEATNDFFSFCYCLVKWFIEFSIIAQGLVFITFYMPRITLFIGKYAFPLTKLWSHVHEWEKNDSCPCKKSKVYKKKRARRSNVSNALKIKIYYLFHTRTSLFVEQCTSLS